MEEAHTYQCTHEHEHDVNVNGTVKEGRPRLNAKDDARGASVLLCVLLLVLLSLSLSVVSVCLDEAIYL